MTPVLKQTDNYGIFELHQFNRDIRQERLDRLIKQMKKVGFRPHRAISVIKNKNGKLTVIDGHHRLTAAMELGIPVWYMLADDVGISIQDDQSATFYWDLNDYLGSYAKDTHHGYHPYRAIRSYMQETGIPLALAIALLAGASAGSGNYVKAFKDGRYTLGNQLHADQVKTIVVHMKKLGIEFAGNSFFIQALSKALRVESFSVSRFKNKISSNTAIFQKQPNVQAYLVLIEKIYNRGSHEKIPVAFLANEVAKERKASFGRRAR